jgi:hypothetical protein
MDHKHPCIAPVNARDCGGAFLVVHNDGRRMILAQEQTTVDDKWIVIEPGKPTLIDAPVEPDFPYLRIHRG